MSQIKSRWNNHARLGFARVRRLSIAFVFTFLASISIAICQSSGQPVRMDIPLFSANATTVYARKAVTSPNGKTLVSIGAPDFDTDDHPANVTIHTERGESNTTVRFGLDTEILWSPDSEAFTLTGSCCGANGQYETDVFFMTGKRLKIVKLTLLIERAFGHPVGCSWPEPPNVAAIKWLVPSKKLLVAAEIIHHSNCDSYGTFRAYVVDLAGPLVIKSYNQIKAKKLYGDDLGEELLQADDNCIRNPKSCVVGSNH
jgi:hypothetical protein